MEWAGFFLFQQKYNLKLLSYEGGPGLENSRINDDEVTKQAVKFNAHGLMEDVLTEILETWYSVVNDDPYNTFPGIAEQSPKGFR